jgi:hypothetical protein
MASLVNAFTSIAGVLVSAVADSGTFTIPYPSGKSQQSFDTGLSDPALCYILLDGDRVNGPTGVSLAFGASLITVTNGSGRSWPAGTEYILNIDEKDGNNVEILTFPIPLAAITGNGDVVTEVRPGIDGVIEYVEWVQTRPVTTASRLATLNLEIGTTNVTGGTVALTSAACTPLGKVIPNTANPSANNRLTKESLLSIEASSVTAFAEGEGYLLVRVRKTESNAY